MTKNLQAAKQRLDFLGSRLTPRQLRRTSVAVAVGVFALTGYPSLVSAEILSGQVFVNTSVVEDEDDGKTGILVGASDPVSSTGVASGGEIDGINQTVIRRAISQPSIVTGNTATNSGSILYSGDLTVGIDVSGINSMTTSAVATSLFSGVGGPYVGVAFAEAESRSQSLVTGNSVTNSGGGIISAVKGISILSSSSASARAIATADIAANTDASNHPTETATASATASATAISSSLLTVTVLNAGSISAVDSTVDVPGTVGTRDAVGISLEAVSLAGAYSYRDAFATVGTCSGGFTQTTCSSGIAARGPAGTEIENPPIADSEATASLTGSSITNTGSLVSTGRGISLTATAEGLSINPFSGSAVVINPVTATATVSNNTITNSGLIVSTRDSNTNGDGVKLEATATGTTSTASVSGNTIINTGFIYSMDDGIQIDISGAGTRLVTGNSITNAYGGRIVANNGGIEIGVGGSGTRTVRGNTLTNSGLIVSDRNMVLSSAGVITKGSRASFDADNTGFRAVEFAGPSGGTEVSDVNTLNLNAPSYISGRFELERQSRVNVNLTSGVSHSVRWVFEDVNTSLGALSFTTIGAVPWFRNDANFASLNNDGDVDVQDNHDDIFATIDPSAFAAAPNQLTDLTGMVSSMAAEGMNRSGVTRNGFWMTVRGSRMDYKGDNRATMDQDTRLQGGAFGFNRDFGDLRVGVMAGYADSELEVGSFYSDLYRYSHENKADGGFAGVHVQGNLGAVKVGLGIMAGAMDHEDRRFVNDNLQWWGESYARATYDSRWYAPELSLSVPVAITETITLTPSLHGRYSVQKFDRYTETGSNSNATVHDHTIKMGEVRAGLDLTKKYAGGSTAGVQLGYVQRDLAGSDTVRVTMIGDTKNVPMFTRELGAGYASVKLNLAVTKAVSFQLDGTYVSGSEGKGGNVGAKLNVEF